MPENDAVSVLQIISFRCGTNDSGTSVFNEKEKKKFLPAKTFVVGYRRLRLGVSSACRRAKSFLVRVPFFRDFRLDGSCRQIHVRRNVVHDTFLRICGLYRSAPIL